MRYGYMRWNIYVWYVMDNLGWYWPLWQNVIHVSSLGKRDILNSLLVWSHKLRYQVMKKFYDLHTLSLDKLDHELLFPITDVSIWCDIVNIDIYFKSYFVVVTLYIENMSKKYDTLLTMFNWDCWLGCCW